MTQTSHGDFGDFNNCLNISRFNFMKTEFFFSNLLLLKTKHITIWVLQLFLGIFHSIAVNINRHWSIGCKMVVEDVLCFKFQLVNERRRNEQSCQ